MAKPVEAGLVSRASSWPGVRVVPDDLGRAHLQAVRPDYYFDEDNAAWPQSATLQLALPELGDLSPDAFRQHVADELEQQEQLAHKTVAANGWALLGVRGVLKTSPFNRATSWEPIRSRNPTFAVGRQQKSAFFEAVAALRAFRRAYREALDRWRSGARDGLFPAGTWMMRMLHGALVALA